MRYRLRHRCQAEGGIDGADIALGGHGAAGKTAIHQRLDGSWPALRQALAKLRRNHQHHPHLARADQLPGHALVADVAVKAEIARVDKAVSIITAGSTAVVIDHGKRDVFHIQRQAITEQQHQ